MATSNLRACGIKFTHRRCNIDKRDEIESCARNEKVKVCNVDDAVLILWCTLHGIASLALNKQMISGKKHAAELARRAVDDLFAAWRAAKCV